MTQRPRTVAVTVVAAVVAVVVGCVSIVGCSGSDAATTPGPVSSEQPDVTAPTVPTSPTVPSAPTPPGTPGDTSASDPPSSDRSDGGASSDTLPRGSASGADTGASASPPARLAGEPNADIDVEDVAARFSALHDTMIDPTAAATERERAGVEYQLLLRVLADRPELDEAVVAAVEPSARPALTRTVRARQFLQARSASRPSIPLPDELPAWTIVEPEPVDTLLTHYADAEALTGIAWYWLAAIHLQETRMGRIQGVSTAGAVGPMQFLPTTWAECCTGDPTVTRDAIIGAATYLAQSGGPADMGAALFQYNPNDGYVAVVTAYAESLRDEPELYVGYHAFQVFFGSSVGTVRLPVGYSQTSPIDAADHLAANPQDAA